MDNVIINDTTDSNSGNKKKYARNITSAIFFGFILLPIIGICTIFLVSFTSVYIGKEFKISDTDLNTTLIKHVWPLIKDVGAAIWSLLSLYVIYNFYWFLKCFT